MQCGMPGLGEGIRPGQKKRAVGDARSDLDLNMDPQSMGLARKTPPAPESMPTPFSLNGRRANRPKDNSICNAAACHKPRLQEHLGHFRITGGGKRSGSGRKPSGPT